MVILSHFAIVGYVKPSAGFTFARALDQAEIQGPLSKVQCVQDSGCEVQELPKGPKWGSGGDPRVKPPKAARFYGILSAKSLPKFCLIFASMILGPLDLGPWARAQLALW